jgi:16S rRNA (cytidine1402-2'-O)-methyltransferase
MDPQFGRLYLVGTPIGNLEDITLRALRILGEVELVVAEDTRRASSLMSALELKRKEIISFNMHNQSRRIPIFLAV